MTCSRDEHPCFFFLFHCCCAVQFQCRHARSTLHESCVMVSEAASCAFYIEASVRVTLTLWLGAEIPLEGGHAAFGLKFQLFLQCAAL